MNFNPSLLYIAVEHRVAELREQARAEQLLRQAQRFSPVHHVLPPNPNNRKRKQTNQTDSRPQAA